jgi:hypothetical protein
MDQTLLTRSIADETNDGNSRAIQSGRVNQASQMKTHLSQPPDFVLNSSGW